MLAASGLVSPGLALAQGAEEASAAEDLGEPGDEPASPALPGGPGAAGASGGPLAPDAGPPRSSELPLREAELARGKTITAIKIVGNKRISTEEIEGLLKWLKPGKPFEPRGMTSDVRDVWESGNFDDIEVDLSSTADEVTLRLLLRERPSILELKWKGNHALSEDDLAEVVKNDLKAGNIFKNSEVRRAVQKLRDKYAEEGRYLAEIEYESVPQKDNQVNLVFTVREHEKVTVRRVTFLGNHSIPDEELREVTQTGRIGLLSFGSGGAFRQDMFERDVLVLQSYYYDKGFLTVQVAAPRIMLTPDRSGIDIVIPIDEGPRYRVRKVEIFEVDADGKRVEPLVGKKRLGEMVRARPGEFFNRAELVKDLGDIQTVYRDKGFAYVDAAPSPQPYPDRKLVDLLVRIKRGQAVKFGRIEIKGNTKTRDKVIRRELEIKEGELFSETLLDRSRERINRLGYFERVDMSTEASEEPGRVNVNIEVTERPTGTFQVGAGFSSIESFIATAQIQQANLFGRGQSLALMAQLSGLRQLVDIRFIEPYLFDTRASAQVNIFDQLRVFSGFSLNSTGGSLALGYPLLGPELTASLTYTLKEDVVDTRTSSTFFGTAQAAAVFQRLPLSNLFTDGITSSLKPTLTYDTRNNRLFPSAGVFVQASTELAIAQLGSANQFIRNHLTARFYYPVTPRVTLKFNSDAGIVTSPSNEGVPLFARYFLGGIFDLRGYRLRTVGPRLPLKTTLDENATSYTNGAVIGGNLQYFQNLELEFSILDAVGLRGVVFTDLGNAWNLEDTYCKASPSAPFEVSDPCFSPGDLFNVRTSWGFGLRWFSPLGPLRFEWGIPFKPLPYEETSVFEFTIGNFF
ncbi:MAG: outer membrane protein assembly factor BamA [Deltaproteobacteria bacterium]|nr:outer membrane protein assembly factor BamA [Deltaproteobacteria bacterium]